jgi:ABC-type cobalamin/Fe3+-siderophores transport system ATPase subunit
VTTPAVQPGGLDGVAAPAGWPVVATGLRFSYPGRGPVLDGVDLAVGPGELVALLGTNGSGKTTLLHLVSGTLRPDAGSITLFGRSLGDWRRLEVARRVAVLPQTLDLPAGFRVGELVAMGRLPHARSRFGTTDADAMAVERALRDADALDLAARPVAELSGGERQRAGIAMALAQEPSLLLLDEPAIHLDLAHQLWLLEMIDRLRMRRGMAVVAVLHDLAMASACPRIAVLDGGRIAADGAPDRVLHPDLVRRVFGVPVEAWRSADGARRLGVVLPIGADGVRGSRG